MKDELGSKLMKEFVGLRAEIYSYSIVDSGKNKTTKGREKMYHKKKT